MKYLTALPSVLLLLACGGENQDTPPSDTPDAATAATSSDTAIHEPVEELTHLHGLSEDEVIETLGTPDYSSMLVLHQGETLHEFYIEIHNTYHPDDPETEGTEIHDLQWYYDDHSKAVFTHRVDDEWIVLESVRWDHGVEF